MSGLIPEPMNCYDDYRLLHYGIGFTNIVARCTKGSADLTRSVLLVMYHRIMIMNFDLTNFFTNTTCRLNRARLYEVSKMRTAGVAESFFTTFLVNVHFQPGIFFAFLIQ